MTTSNKRFSSLLPILACILAVIGCSKDMVNSDFRQRLDSFDPDVRYHAVSQLSFSKRSGAVELLVVALSDPDARVRSVAADALGRRKARSATDKLIYLLGDNDMVVRGTAAEALGNIGESKATVPLIKLLGDTLAKRPKGPYSTEDWGEDAESAVSALIRITGTNFGFDVIKWNAWEAERKASQN
jgi:HEAT repeat protein